MSSAGPRWLAVAALAAAIIEVVGAVGWWSWHRVVRQLASDAVRGAELLADDPLLHLPPVARRTRRLPGALLAEAPIESVVSALRSLSGDQLRWAPTDPYGFVNRGRAELLEGLFDGASDSLAAAVLRDPTSPEIHRLAALTERARGNNEQALDHLATAAGISSRDVSSRVELTPEEGDWVRLEGLERRLDFYPRAKSRGVISLARELRARDREELGRNHLEEESADPRVVLELARWDLDAGMTGRAEERLIDLVGRRGLPASILADAWSITAMVRDRHGDFEGAVAAADLALTYDPRSASPYRVLATLAERRGDVAGALEHLRRAWGMNPTDVNLLLAVARTAEKAGRDDDARLALERALMVDPTNPTLPAMLVEYHLRRDEFMQATLTLSDALDRFPTDPRLLRLADRLRAEVIRR